MAQASACVPGFLHLLSAGARSPAFPISTAPPKQRFSLSQQSILYFLYVFYFIQVIIQNPTPVLINHATSVILKACENARKLSTFALQIIASS